MQKLLYTTFLIIVLYFNPLGQGILKVTPDHLEFGSLFNRITDVKFINVGNAPLTIVNINYKKPELYFIRFSQYGNYPFTLAPNDTVHMDCILAGYYYLTQQDSVDTMFVYNNGTTQIEPIKIKIDFFETNQGLGSINGNIRAISTGGPIADAKINFLFGGNYFITSTYSDAYGNYSVQVPAGDYIIAAEKDSFYTTFGGGQFDPFTSTIVHVIKNSVSTENIDMPKMISTGFSISGNINDIISNQRVTKAVVVIRVGTHTPGKLSILQDSIPTKSYTVFTDANGNYNLVNIPQPGYYYLQAFSDFYVPSYYSNSGPSPAFWQQADSIQIDNIINNKNISMQRDSSTGGGIISGTIKIGSNILDNKIIVYANSLDYNQPFNYTLPLQGNSFTLNNLPYGRYRLIGQLIGYPDAYADSLNITPIDTMISGITLNFATTGIQNEPNIPTTAELLQNYPNPFNPSTTIQFRLTHSANISLKVYNFLGQEIETLANGYYKEGDYLINWDAKKLASGVYFYVLHFDDAVYTKKMTLIK
ncbi:MAG: T9SS type A sorting domain-containing protein [Ignavibacteriaceae bacterium]|nr:T9SS type A sorting domain-containing protein [Ignavibacteriaceae bacterium]